MLKVQSLRLELIMNGQQNIELVQQAWAAYGRGRIAAFREFMDVQVAVEAFQCYPLTAGAAAGTPAPH
ncbi:hypothetical protein ACHAC9_14970 [Massilia sp. CMS3.1]|uniref:hypothetical protein n=1 Tax=Massilia sp. CMS3.1 TaxID=3373083 RepID=UPI003EE65F02